MTTRNPWNPTQEMRRLQLEMEHLFGDLAPVWRWPLTGEYPPINIMRSDAGLTVEAICPGVERDTFDITVVGDSVTIRCERKPPPDVRPERYPDRTQATYTNGILRVALSRAAEAAPRKIAIQS